MRVVVDTNVWISALLNPAGHPARVRKALEEGRFSLVVSAPVLEELARVMVRPRLALRYGLGLEDAFRLLALVRDQAGELADVTGEVRLCRDPRDDMFVETALKGRADVLVSRDDDLKGASELISVLMERGVRVLTVQRFLDALEKPSEAGR
jgi:putative PIN family toxin of toxin-antitoxin system